MIHKLIMGVLSHYIHTFCTHIRGENYTTCMYIIGQESWGPSQKSAYYTVLSNYKALNSSQHEHLQFLLELKVFRVSEECLLGPILYSDFGFSRLR